MRSPRKKENRGNPTVLISPLRRHRKQRNTEVEEPSDDEVQLCRVRSTEGSPERSNTTQRSHIARMYHQSPQRLSSSSRIPSDSWQEASTEPLVPQTPNEDNLTKNKDNEIKSDTSNVVDTPKTSGKRKTEESLETDSQHRLLRQSQGSQDTHSNAYFNKKLQLQSSQQPSASSSRIPSDSWQDAPTEPLAQPTANEDSFSIPKADTPVDVLGKRKADTSIDSDVLSKALRKTQEYIKQELETKKENDYKKQQAKLDDNKSIQQSPKEANDETKPQQQQNNQPRQSTTNKAEGNMGPPNQQQQQQQQGNKRPTREEEEARIAQEIDHLMKTVKCLPNYYKLVDKIGEGTFSTVYKAQDIRRDYYDNNEWEPQLLESAQNSMVSPSSTPTRPTVANGKEGENNSSQSPPSSPKDLSEFVALKRVYDTSSPRRIANEIKILKKLKGSKCISPMITAFRQQDQVFVVMPYIQHDDFKPSFSKMELIDIKYYMKSLFTALQQLHRFKILHRDVKPNNFLYNIRKRAGYLIDFGLAESEEDVKLLELYVEKAVKASKFNVYSQTHHNNNSSNGATSNNINSNNKLGPAPLTKMASSNSVLAALTNKENRAGSTSNSSISATSSSSSVVTTPTPTASTSTSSNRSSNRVVKGYIKNDPRLAIRANRAGTRGFRAPEILMRVTHQTCAIDIWAAGVILLCLLTNTYPFFVHNDEADALVELGQVYGLDRMQECARVNNRHFETNVNIPKDKLPWASLIETLNKEKMQSWDQRDFDAAVDLLRRSLELNPNKRITAEEALKLEFLQID